MAQHTSDTILRRMLRPAGPVAPVLPVSSERVLRIAITRAADDALGLTLTLREVVEDISRADGLVAQLSDELIMLALTRNGAVTGVLAMDQQMLAAVIEMQTMGRLSTAMAQSRRLTKTDVALLSPFADAVLAQIKLGAADTPLGGWCAGHHLGDPVGTARAFGLVLTDVVYRMMRMTVAFGANDRQGQIIIAMPDHAAQTAAPVPDHSATAQWISDLNDTVLQSHAGLNAQLHKMSLPYAMVEDLQIGQVIPLIGCTVDNVEMMAPGSVSVGQARLGQLAGKRAVRIQHTALRQLADLPRVGAGSGDLPRISTPDVTEKMA